MAGTLYLVPNLLGLVPPEHVLPARTIAIARRLGHFIVENAKPARAFLKSIDPALPLREIAMSEIGTDLSAAYVGGLTRLTFGNSSHWKRVLPTQVAA